MLKKFIREVGDWFVLFPALLVLCAVHALASTLGRERRDECDLSDDGMPQLSEIAKSREAHLRAMSAHGIPWRHETLPEGWREKK